MVLKVLELHLACDILLVFYVPDALLMIGLPDGPTAHFKLSKLVLRKDIKVLYLLFGAIFRVLIIVGSIICFLHFVVIAM